MVMPLDRRIDHKKFSMLLKSAVSRSLQDAIAAAILRNIIKEIKRAGCWQEWTRGDEGIIEEELWYPFEMLEPDDKLSAYVMRGDEHFSFVAKLILHRARPNQLNDTERDFLADVQCYRSPSDRQMDWLTSLAKRMKIDWTPPDNQRSDLLRVSSASRKG
jgi:hypothetical protein